MENVSRVQRWYSPIAERIHVQPVRPMLLAGLGLVAILAGLAAFNPLLGIISALMLLLLVVVLPRPILIVYGLSLILPIVGGLARGLGVPFLRIGQALLVLGFLLFALAIPSRQGKTRLTAIDLAFALYFLTDSVLPVLALLYRGEPLDLSASNVFTGVTPLQTLLGPLQYYVLYRIVVALVSSERQIKILLNLSFLSSIVVSVVGILQKLGVGPVVSLLNMYYPTIDLGYAVSDLELRITSTLDSYSGLAAYLAFTIIVALACYTVQKQLKFSVPLLATTVLFDSIALLLTGTFAPCMGLAIGAAIVFLLMRRIPRSVIYVLVGMALALLAFAPFFADRISGWIGGGGGVYLPTYAYRIMLWQQIFLPAIFSHLWFGAGPAPAVSQLWPSEETQYFALLLQGGLPDLLSYIVLMSAAIVICWRQIKRSKTASASRVVAIATLSILVAINVMNVSAVYFSYVGGTQTIWILLAITVASGQVKTLEAATTAPVVNRSLVGNRLANQRTSFGTSILIPSYAEPETVGLSLYRERFSWLKRLLDWHFVKDSVVVGAGMTISRILGLLFMTLLAHFLLPDSFGFFRYALGLISVVGIISASYPISIGRFLAANTNDPQARDRYFTNGLLSIVLLLILSLLISIPVLWSLHALDPGILICILCLAIFNGYFYIVRGLGSAWKMGLTNALSNIVLVVALFIVIAFLKMHTATVALALYGLADVVPLFLLEMIEPMSLRFRLKLISKAGLLELARFAAPLVTATGIYTIWYEADILLVGNLDPHMAGTYAAAKTLAQAFLIVPSAVTMVLMPKVAAMDPNKSKRYAIGAVLMAFVLCLCGLVFVSILGHTLIAFTFGERYRDSYLPLLVLSVGMSFYSMYILLEAFIIGRGRPGLAVRALGTALVSTGIIGFWLTPRLGLLGASLAFTSGAILGAVVMFFNTWRFLRKENVGSRV